MEAIKWEEKTKQLVAFILKERLDTTVTGLIKICYLIDLTSKQRNNKQISEFSYRRYNYGPFDEKIYPIVTELNNENIINGETRYANAGDEYVVYNFNNQFENLSFDKLSEEEITIIKDTLKQLEGLGAKVLTEVAYKTKPMLAFNASLGGREHFNELLDLDVK
ncbi:MAG: Panacea domain-containing protein [Patescibacteria group bacterium]|nr:Panacea domain-containing protein [Patescibacteria group bacterium]